MTIVVRRIDAGDAGDVATHCRLRTECAPDDADPPSHVAWEDATHPGQVWRFVADLDGEPSGAATTDRLHIYGPEHPRFYLGAWVLEARRRRDVGSAPYRAVSTAAREAEKTGFQTWVSAVRSRAEAASGPVILAACPASTSTGSGCATGC